MQSSMVAMDSIQPNWIALMSRVVSESPHAPMSRQYLWGTSRLDTFHNNHEVFISDGREEMQHVRALIECGATSIFKAPRLRKWLGLLEDPGKVWTAGLHAQGMVHTSQSRKMAFTSQYLEHLSPVQELEVMVVPM